MRNSPGSAFRILEIIADEYGLDGTACTLPVALYVVNEKFVKFAMLNRIVMAIVNISDFVKSWIGKGDEKQDTQRFWMDLLQKVLGLSLIHI